MLLNVSTAQSLDESLKGVRAEDHQHVSYESLVKDPIGTVKGLYSSFGWEYTQQVRLGYLPVSGWFPPPQRRICSLRYGGHTKPGP